MKAIVVHEFGGPEKLRFEEMPKPSINAEDVLIKVMASGVNPVDWKVRKGYMKHSLPFIPGWDVSGVIEEVGSGVKTFKKGDEIYGRPDISRNGTYAEYVTVRASEIAMKPTSIDHTQAAGIPLAGLTAWQGLFEYGKLEAGQKILIHGASGGVGTFAVQLAKWKGAYVIGTASVENKEYLERLGIDEIIDYATSKFEDQVRELDMVFDTIGGNVQARSRQILKRGGILVSTVGVADKDAFEKEGIRCAAYMTQSKPGDLKEIARLIDEKKVKVIISKIFPLKDAAEAQRLSEEGHVRGKIVLQVREDKKTKERNEEKENVLEQEA